MSSIALFPCTFTNSSQLGDELAANCNLEMYDDKKLIHDTALQFKVAPDKLAEALYRKSSVFNQFTLEREKHVNLLKTTLATRLAEHPDTLFNGFHVLLIPDTIPHVLKLLIVDNKTNRIERAIDSGLSEKEAKKLIKADDVSAYGWSDFLFKKEAYDSTLYDVVIPADGKKTGELIDTVKKYFHSTSVLLTTESAQSVADFRLSVDTEKILLEKGHKLQVAAHKGAVTLSVEKSVLNFTRLQNELTSLVAKIDGVLGIEVEKSTNYSVSVYRQQRFELPSKVLFVDDEKEFVQTVSERLISRDVGTYGVFNGDDALELVVKDSPEVMVLDLKMPGMHGVEVLRRTKELSPDIEVIILTGHGTREDMRQCMELGAFAYMNKPVDIEELSATIQAANEAVVIKRAA